MSLLHISTSCVTAQYHLIVSCSINPVVVMLHITQWDYADVVLLHITQLLYCSKLPICGTAQYYPVVSLLHITQLLYCFMLPSCGTAPDYPVWINIITNVIICYLHLFIKCINIVNNDTEVIIVPGGKYWSEQRACDTLRLLCILSVISLKGCQYISRCVSESLMYCNCNCKSKWGRKNHPDSAGH